jgi:hypothetical protein
MKLTSLVAVLVFLAVCFLGSARAQTHDKKDEIPIERCDRLPVVTMKVAGEKRRFLLDTAATTILNLKSFASGESQQIHIYSWSGGAATSAREIFLPQVELGTHKLRDLKLSAIDLSPIGKACGGQIDGILGVDLLDQMGMTIDLKRRVAVPAPAVEPADSANELPRRKATWGLATSLSITEMPLTQYTDQVSILIEGMDGSFQRRNDDDAAMCKTENRQYNRQNRTCEWFTWT